MAFPISANDGAAAAKGKARSEQGGAGQWGGDAAGVWEDLPSCQNAHKWPWLLLCLVPHSGMQLHFSKACKGSARPSFLK